MATKVKMFDRSLFTKQEFLELANVFMAKALYIVIKTYEDEANKRRLWHSASTANLINMCNLTKFYKTFQRRPKSFWPTEIKTLHEGAGE